MENAGLVVRVFVCRRFQRVDAGSPEQSHSILASLEHSACVRSLEIDDLP
jgi:hypothetical protein